MTEQERYENMVDEIIDLKNKIKDLQAENEEKQQLIDHLEAENYVLMEDKEKLKAENERLEHQLETLCLTLKLAKAEAYKEFAEEVFELFPADKPNTVISRVTVKHILKELVGEDK